MQVFEGYDLIVDGTDNFATRYMVNDAAYFLGIPYVWGSIYRFDGQASVFAPTLGDDAALLPLPLPRAAAAGHGPELRRGRRAGRAVREHRLDPGHRGDQAARPASASPLVGSLMIYDALEMEYRKLKVRKDPNCALCGENATVTDLIDYDAFCGAISDEAADAAAGSTISVTDLEQMLKEREEGTRDFVLVDVREPNEYEINQIPGAVLIPKGEFLNGNALERAALRTSRSCCTARPGSARPRRSRCSRAPGYSDAVHVGGGVVGLGRPDRPLAAVVLSRRGARCYRRVTRRARRRWTRVMTAAGDPGRRT